VQNISKEEVKTILTRVGEGTKIVMLGDVSQIDSPKLDRTNNGLSYIIEKFRDCELAAHITLKEGVRSPLATKASEILLNVNG
jgi:PhoH-like ATPase